MVGLEWLAYSGLCLTWFRPVVIQSDWVGIVAAVVAGSWHFISVRRLSGFAEIAGVGSDGIGLGLD